MIDPKTLKIILSIIIIIICIAIAIGLHIWGRRYLKKIGKSS